LTASLIDNQVCEEDEEKSGGIPLDDISGAFIIVSVGILFAVIGRVWIKSFGILLDLIILGHSGLKIGRNSYYWFLCQHQN